MRRRTLLGLFAATPLAAVIGCRDIAKAAPVEDLGDPTKVGTRAWYIQRLYDNAAEGAPICTRDNGALFDYCQRLQQRGLITHSTFFPNSRNPVTGREPVLGRDAITGTDQYIYWWMPRRGDQRGVVLAGLKAAAARDASFGRLPTFVQPATRTRHV